jgi:hypothetical protein
MRCAHGCGGRVLTAWLQTGPVLNTRVRPRRVALPPAGGEGITAKENMARSGFWLTSLPELSEPISAFMMRRKAIQLPWTYM